jgi:hypothetical protein
MAAIDGTTRAVKVVEDMGGQASGLMQDAS